ncbi:MAG TPA: putative holin-like toxin [Bacilli bacterium]|nr:putative holin-like toxin [Bacilli bacterium]
MSQKDVIALMLQFGMFVIALLSLVVLLFTLMK